MVPEDDSGELAKAARDATDAAAVANMRLAEAEMSAMSGEASAGASIAANIRDARAAAEMTQADLAAAMTKRGFKWHGPTVYKVENGERQILLSEGLALADIFGIGLSVLSVPPEFLKARLKLKKDLDNLEDSIRALAAAIRKFDSSAAQMRVRLDETPDAEEHFGGPDMLRRVQTFVSRDSPVVKAVNRAETMLLRWGTDASET